MRRGSIWWVDLGEPQGSGPGFERPCVIVSAKDFNDSSLATVIIVMLTSNLKYSDQPGNFRVPTSQTGLDRPSVLLISQIFTVDRRKLLGKIGRLPDDLVQKLNASLKLVLGLT